MWRRRSRAATDNHGAPRLAAWSVRRPWRALLAWLVIVVLCIAGGVATGTNLVEDGQGGSGDSGRAETIISDANFPDDPAEERALVSRRDGADKARVARLQQQVVGLMERDEAFWVTRGAIDFGRVVDADRAVLR